MTDDQAFERDRVTLRSWSDDQMMDALLSVVAGNHDGVWVNMPSPVEPIPLADVLREHERRLRPLVLTKDPHKTLAKMFKLRAEGRGLDIHFG